MAKKKGISIGIIILVIMIIALFVIIQPQLFSITTGVPFSIQSITAFNQAGQPITLVSNDSELATVNFRADVVVGSVGNESFTAQNLGGVLEGGVSYDRTADFTVQQIEDYYQFPVSNLANEELSRYALRTVNWFGTCPTISYGTPAFVINSGIVGSTKYCVYRQRVGVRADLGAPNYSSETLVKLKVKDASSGSVLYSDNVKVNNGNTRTAEFRDDSTNKFLGEVQFVQLGASNLTQPDQTKVVAVRNGEFDDWHLALKSKYDRYHDFQSEMEYDFARLQTRGFTSDFSWVLGGSFGIPISCVFTQCEQDLQTIINELNTRVDALSTANDVIPYQNAQTYQSWGDNDYQGGTWLVSPAQTVFKYPNLLFSVTAESVGASLSVGIPRINSITPQTLEFPFGDSSPHSLTINVTAQSGSGCFMASLESCNAFIFSSSTSLCLNEGETGDVVLTVLPRQSQAVPCGTCNVKVYDTSKPSNSATGTFQGCLEEYQTCNPIIREYDVRGTQIFKCVGGEWVFQKNCPSGIIYVEGATQDGTNQIPDCRNPLLCGNNQVDSGEDCDGIDLAGQTCQSLGYSSGTLACTASCVFLVNGCTGTSPCQEGQIYRESNQSCEDCENISGDGIFILGYKIVQKNTPIYLISFPWGGGLIQIGVNSELNCQPIYNWLLIVGLIIAIIITIILAYYTIKKVAK